MAKLKMGIHNRITERRFYAIKTALNKGMACAKAMATFRVSKSTINKVRRCKNYRDYKLENQAKHVEIKVIAPKSGLMFEDYAPKSLHHTNALDREAENTAKAAGICLIGMLVIFALAAIVAIVEICK